MPNKPKKKNIQPKYQFPKDTFLPSAQDSMDYRAGFQSAMDEIPEAQWMNGYNALQQPFNGAPYGNDIERSAYRDAMRQTLQQYTPVNLLPEYKKGGKIDPLYVDSKNDPRYKSYQDSLSLYNKGENEYNRYKQNVRKGNLPKGALWEDNDAYVPDQRIQPMSQHGYFWSQLGGNIMDGRNEVAHIPEGERRNYDTVLRYYKPTQPVVVGSPIEPLNPIQPNISGAINPQLREPLPTPQMRVTGHHSKMYQMGKHQLSDIVPDYSMQEFEQGGQIPHAYAGETMYDYNAPFRFDQNPIPTEQMPMGGSYNPYNFQQPITPDANSMQSYTQPQSTQGRNMGRSIGSAAQAIGGAAGGILNGAISALPALTALVPDNTRTRRPNIPLVYNPNAYGQENSQAIFKKGGKMECKNGIRVSYDDGNTWIDNTRPYEDIQSINTVPQQPLYPVQAQPIPNTGGRKQSKIALEKIYDKRGKQYYLPRFENFSNAQARQVSSQLVSPDDTPIVENPLDYYSGAYDYRNSNQWQPTMKMGGNMPNYNVGDEIELTNEEIIHLRSLGYKLK